ncbi:hypothetical protein HG263_07590 [Pseudoalteromonas sp. JBTF-M23]|uniref:Uncharacterized protein n=1 Tax=Pseudoalteromonas caenipelagi TaxID=2726988 RepID=A0A849VCW5_9GAMM|nr:hypothetical protein [Pseudoalteromonas caenipelagi]NOU50403.1 hypothetical protein [Pseudoalteromonas caenipelagi]
MDIIEAIVKTTLTLHQPIVPDKAKSTSANNEPKDFTVPTLRMPPEAMKKLNKLDKDEEKEDSRPALPAHIEALVEQRKKIKEQIKEQKEQLDKLKSRDDLDEEIKTNLLKQQSDYLMQLQIQLMGITQSLQDALKEAGISDLGLLADVLV